VTTVRFWLVARTLTLPLSFLFLIPLDWPDLPGRSWRLTDILGPNVFKRDGGELASPGLVVDLGPWQFHLLALQ
jgi:hypothetical protein